MLGMLGAIVAGRLWTCSEIPSGRDCGGGSWRFIGSVSRPQLHTNITATLHARTLLLRLLRMSRLSSGRRSGRVSTNTSDIVRILPNPIETRFITPRHTATHRDIAVVPRSSLAHHQDATMDVKRCELVSAAPQPFTGMTTPNRRQSTRGSGPCICVRSRRRKRSCSSRWWYRRGNGKSGWHRPTTST